MAKGSYLGSFAEGFINAFLQARRQRMYEQYFRMLMLKNGYNPDTGKYTDPAQKIKDIFQQGHDSGFTTGTTSFHGGSSSDNEPSIHAHASDLERLKSNIGNMESGNNYQAMGPQTKNGDYAVGKYQVMASNVGPWTKSILGKEMTPDEFKHDPRAQEAIADTKLGEYLRQTGSPADAASMWFTGRPLAQGAHSRDALGTTGAEYARKATQGLPFQPYHVAGAMQPPPSGQGQVNTLQSMQGDSGRPPLGGPMYQPHTAPAPPAAEQDYWAQRGGAESGMTGAPPAGAIPAARGQMPPRTSTPRPDEPFETGYPSSAPGGPAYPPQNMDTVQPQHPDTARYPGWPTPGVTDEQPQTTPSASTSQTVIPPRGSTTTPQRTAAPSSPERVPLPPDFRDFGMQRNAQGFLVDKNTSPSPAAQPAPSSPVTAQGQMGHYIPTIGIARGPGTYVQDSPSAELHAPPTWTAENLPKTNTNPRPQYKPPQTYPVQDRRPTPGVDAPNVNQPSQQSPYVPQSQPVIPPAASSLNAMDDNVLPGESWHAAYGGPVPGTIVAPQQNPTGTSSMLGAANALGGSMSGSAPSMGAIPSPGMGAGAASGAASGGGSTPSPQHMGGWQLSGGLPINYSAASPAAGMFAQHGNAAPVGDYSSQYNTAGGNSGGAGAGGNAAGGVSGAASASGW